MVNINLEDTIAAVSTATGNGGIGIVRVSGGEAIDIVDKIFVPVKGGSLKEKKSHTITYGNITANGRKIDEVLVSVMKAPNTYTKENVVEINTHGGVRAVTSVLECVLQSGARIAEPGEFTKRAFLNGRLDLTQAEAVMDIINAKTELSKQAALLRLEGRLGKKVRELRDRILTMTAGIEAAIDYPEHDDEIATYSNTREGTISLIDELNYMLKGADTGRVFREGIKTVILGRPNVGKSSLLNALLEEERAIVTDIPGTTRDGLQEYINVRGVPLNIIDTAGIRVTDDEIERLGVERSKKYAEEADLILMMLDGSRELEDEDIEILQLVCGKKVILLVNKVDLEVRLEYGKISKYIPKEFIIDMSVKTEQGIDLLYDLIRDMFLEGGIDVNREAVISNERNKASIYNAIKSLNNVIETIDSGMPEDFLSMDLMEAYRSLGEITGEAVEEDIIDKIFSEFCLGK